jgi:spore coat protein H
MLSLLILAACGTSQVIAFGGESEGDTGQPAPIDTGVEELPGDTDTSEDTSPPKDPEAERAWQDAFFVDTVIHEIEITLDDTNYRDLRRDGHSYVSGNLTINGDTVTNVGVRLRGKIGSYRELYGKPKFKIDMSEYVGGQRIHGLKTVLLNNEVVDCGYLKEPIAYAAYRNVGITASRTSFARVTVNGDAYGLYVVIEAPDGEFLENRFDGDESKGNLYDGKYIYNWNTRNYTLLDFDSGVDELFGLEEGEDVGHVDISGISDAAHDAGDEGFTAAMEPLMDWEQWHSSWAVEQWVGHLDGYQMNKNNYRVYFRPSDGRMTYVPFDFDYAFLSDGGWGVWWTGPIGKLAQECMADRGCRADHVASVEDMLGKVDAAALRTKLDAMRALIREDIENDPRRECSASQAWAYQDALASWIDGREAAVRATWGL